MNSVFSYIDFREYIRDFYVDNKKRAGLSYREFSKMAGFSSPVFIKLVIEGKTNVTKSSISKLCNAMGLKREERQYFKNLVLFSQTKNIDAKMEYLQTMKRIQSPLPIDELTDEQFEYFSRWYNPIIKELIDIIDFDGNYQTLAKLITPPITDDEAREAVELLKKLGLVREENGQFVSTHKFVTSSGLSAGTIAVRSMQQKMALLAAEAVETIPKELRDISGVSVNVSSKSMEKIREELANCRRNILEIASKDDAGDGVFRVNLHLFPISQRVPETMLKRKRGRD